MKFNANKVIKDGQKVIEIDNKIKELKKTKSDISQEIYTDIHNFTGEVNFTQTFGNVRVVRYEKDIQPKLNTRAVLDQLKELYLTKDPSVIAEIVKLELKPENTSKPSKSFVLTIKEVK
jgi:virulence-associated protein VapD